jgi:drug/metabolite transporter (DMT)-like permease
VPAEALLLALGAAGLHALWNVLLARARDPVSAGAVMLVVGPIAFAPVAALSWDLDAAALPYIAGSAALQLTYFVLLTAAYSRSELSLVYPVARGLAPVLVLIVGAVALAATPSGKEAAGVGLVALGVLLVRGLRRPADARGVVLGAAIAACIAGYTLIDNEGIEHAGPVAYFELVAVATAVVYVPLVARLKGFVALRSELSPATAAAGIAAFATYLLVLAALELASAASVAAVRETSVVMAVGLAALLLGERVGVMRLAGAALVAGGVALIALG